LVDTFDAGGAMPDGSYAKSVLVTTVVAEHLDVMG
jgi:hypothetical protein